MKEKNPLLYLFGQMWKYSSGNHRKIVAFWTMFVVSQCIDTFGVPLIWARIIEIIGNTGINWQSFWKLESLLGILMIRVFVVWSLHGPGRVMELTNAFKAKVNVRAFFTKGIFGLPLDWHTNHHSGDTIDKITKGTTALHDFSEGSFEMVYILVRLVACITMLVFLDPMSIISMIPMMCMSAWLTMRFDNVLIERFRQINAMENKIAESIQDAITNISTVIIKRVENLVYDAIMHKVAEPFELTRNTNILQEKKWFVTTVCCYTMMSIVLTVYFLEHMGTGPGVLLSTGYLVINYLKEIGDLFFEFCSRYGEIMKRKTRMSNAEELSKDFVPTNLSNHVLPETWKKISIERLSFSHQTEEGARLHLDEVSLEFERGEYIALIGERGSGKSTFLHILHNVLEAKEVTLKVDGICIPEGFAGIRNASSLSEQEVNIFATSILQNITMGAEYDMETVVKFTDMACFTDVVHGLPNGFQSSIREKGVNLSGGQKQCLALARGLLASNKKDIVFLDEPTSSLDPVTQLKVYLRILDYFRGKTVFSTLHQLHLLPLFHRVVVFKDGRIVGVGTIPELRETCPEFVSLCSAMQDAQASSMMM